MRKMLVFICIPVVPAVDFQEKLRLWSVGIDRG